MEERITDLPFKGPGRTITIIRPRTDLKKEIFLCKEYHMEQYYNDVMTRWVLLHAGNLRTSHELYSRAGAGRIRKLFFQACGGSITNQTRQNSSYNTVTIGCSKCLVEFEIPDYAYSEDDLTVAMLHLMIKQMIPDMPFCQYIDCGLWRGSSGDDPEEIEAVRQLGLVSFIEEEPCANLSGLGFILMPGMRTLYGCDGFDEWLKFLVKKKFEQMHRFLKISNRKAHFSLLGPKKIV